MKVKLAYLLVNYFIYIAIYLVELIIIKITMLFWMINDFNFLLINILILVIINPLLTKFMADHKFKKQIKKMELAIKKITEE